MNILLLSAYDAKSHQYWRKGLVEHCAEHEWRVLTLPARFYSWRVRGNSLTWAYSQQELLARHYDLIIATSMTDLSALKGLAPSLARIPSILYFHENQFEYPNSGREFSSVEPQILSIYSALSASKIVFNSEFNRSTFLVGAKRLLKKLPDQVPKGIVEILSGKSQVLAVPLNEAVCDIGRTTPEKSKLSIIWNHRWEYDKGPELLYQVLKRLRENTEHFTIHIVGQSFTQVPEMFERIKREFMPYIGRWGYVEDQELLKAADVVLSTAAHDFQGLSVLEAVQHGAIPVIPNGLAYPEYFDSCYLYGLPNASLEDRAQAAVSMLSQHAVDKQHCRGPFKQVHSIATQNLNTLLWSNLKNEYEQLINGVVETQLCGQKT